MSKPKLNPADLPDEFGRYKISKCLGKGGMGAVYRAWDPALEREVALKVPFINESDPSFVARFQREAKVAAAVQHSGICSIYDVGEFGGVPYFTMQFVQGEPLSDLLSRGEPLIPETVIQIAIDLAEAVQFAHDQGVMHRDLKPSNVMLDLGGNPRILDFGLSRRLNADEVLTATGQLMGTPAYMSPEQAKGANSKIGPQTDIFSLGVILYEMLTGTRPFKGDSIASILMSIIGTEPPPPSELREGLDKRLDAICAKAMAKSTAKRYASSAEMIEDLAAVQADISLPSMKRLNITKSTMVVVTACVLIIGGGLFFFTDSKSDRDQVVGNEDQQQNSTEASNKSEEAKNSAEATPTEADTQISTSESNDSSNIALRATAILKKYCYDCHGLDFAVPGLDVSDRRALISQMDDDVPPFIVAGDLEQSSFWDRVGVNKDMPPDDAPQPTEAERQVLGAWITAGVPFPDQSDRKLFSQHSELQLVSDYLQDVNADDRRFQRFFTLVNLYNSADIDEDKLNQSRAALSKVVNSLSWKKAITIPQMLGTEGVVLAIDLRDFGWTIDQWEKILEHYPYGVRPSSESDLFTPSNEIAEETGTQIATVRLDWFIATASRPPLYESILGLPQDVGELEKNLDVDVKQDFLNGRLMRAAFLTSGVSDQNRLVDRHDALYGAYWKSYDFLDDEDLGDLTRFPLGPIFHENPYERHAFQHDGGEMIFNLPNGLQGYLLTDGKGQQISEGPIKVVSDPAKSSGSNIIVNGISCMFCHREGMIDFQDQLRDGSMLKGESLSKVHQLYAPQDEMQDAVNADRHRFRSALVKAVLPMLPGRTVDDTWPELVNLVARRYFRDLTMEDLAIELGFADVAEFEKLVRPRLEYDPDIERLGLKPILEGGRIPRKTWSALNIPTRFQEMSRKLKGSTPLTIF